jgi:hypothetical protein
MNSDTTIDDIEHIINKYDSDHTMAYFLIEEIIRNYRNIQLDKFQYEQNDEIPQNYQKQLQNNSNQLQITQPIMPTIARTDNLPIATPLIQHNKNMTEFNFNINDYNIYDSDGDNYNDDNNDDDNYNDDNYDDDNYNDDNYDDDNYNDNLYNAQNIFNKNTNQPFTKKNKSNTSNNSTSNKPDSAKQIPTKPKTIECSCCYDLFADDEITACSEEHIFCKECVKKYACQLIYENCNAHITCINVGGKCNGIFDEKKLENILDQRVMNEYKRVKIQNELKEISNSIDDINIKICANCEKGVDIGYFELEQLFCTECGKETCLKCNQLAHEGKPCFANGNVRTDKRLELEDKITEELLIRCDNCHKMIFKDQGCNKVTCTCKTTMCAICKKNITKEGYNHFAKSKQCNLYMDENAKKKKIMSNLATKDTEENRLLKSLI